MALWGSKDQANNSPIYVAQQVNAPGGVTTTNRDNLYNNVVTSAWVTNANVGVFGVSTEEIANTTGEGHAVSHTGWHLRTEGTGGRAGRVHYETLVAMKSITIENPVVAANDDVQLPE